MQESISKFALEAHTPNVDLKSSKKTTSFRRKSESAIGLRSNLSQLFEKNEDVKKLLIVQNL